MNEILQHPELMYTFLVGNHCHILWMIIKSNAVNISKSTKEYYQQEAKGLKADRDSDFKLQYPHFDQINQYK